MLILSWCQSVLYKQESDGSSFTFISLRRRHRFPTCAASMYFCAACIYFSLCAAENAFVVRTPATDTPTFDQLFTHLAPFLRLFFSAPPVKGGESWRVNARARHRIFWGEVQGMHLFALIHRPDAISMQWWIISAVFLYEGAERNSIHTFIHSNKSGTMTLAEENKMNWIEKCDMQV